jgi:hypothetical protein
MSAKWIAYRLSFPTRAGAEEFASHLKPAVSKIKIIKKGTAAIPYYAIHYLEFTKQEKQNKTRVMGPYKMKQEAEGAKYRLKWKNPQNVTHARVVRAKGSYWVYFKDSDK